MFEQRADRSAVVAELRRRLADTAPPPAPSAPTATVIPVLSPLEELLPHRGLLRGSVISVQPDPDSVGATSLLFALLAGPTRPWSALLGFRDLGLAAAAELGVDLRRVVLIPEMGADALQILSILIDGVDLVAVSLAGPLGPPARLRVLSARLRQRGAVVIALGPWPGADLTLAVSTTRWSGIGAGHGRLRDRELLVRLGGRRAGSAAAEVRVELAESRLDNQVRLHRAAPAANPRERFGVRSA